MIIIDKNGIFKENGEKVGVNDVASFLDQMLDEMVEKTTETLKKVNPNVMDIGKEKTSEKKKEETKEENPKIRVINIDDLMARMAEDEKKWKKEETPEEEFDIEKFFERLKNGPVSDCTKKPERKVVYPVPEAPRYISEQEVFGNYRKVHMGKEMFMYGDYFSYLKTYLIEHFEKNVELERSWLLTAEHLLLEAIRRNDDTFSFTELRLAVIGDVLDILV